MNMVLTAVLRDFFDKNTYITKQLPQKAKKNRKKNIMPKRSTIIGFWGGKVPQCSCTTSLRSSGNPSIWDDPKR